MRKACDARRVELLPSVGGEFFGLHFTSIGLFILVFFTSASPVNMRTVINVGMLERAADGVARLNSPVRKIPIPKTFLPPHFLDSNPPGICVTV